MNTSDFDFDLPRELIAQNPLPERTDSRMMVIDRAAATISHHGIRELPDFLEAGDLLVTNNTRVIPARLFGTWEDTGGKVEVLLVEEVASDSWLLMCRSARRVREGQKMSLCEGQLKGEVKRVEPGGRVLVCFACDQPFMQIVDRFGVPPVPPYIQREGDRDPRVDLDRDRYQTVYARVPGAIAAPTAGLHFSEELLKEIETRGILRTEITLHVGPGTFRPVQSDSVAAHEIESERYRVSEEAAELLESTRAGDGRITAIGTTSVRTLETLLQGKGRFLASEGASALFIHPPFQFLAIDRLLTNFHLPRSTLLMLVTAFASHGMDGNSSEAGLRLILDAYNEAVKKEYRFYSYGDCMLLL